MTGNDGMMAGGDLLLGAGRNTEEVESVHYSVRPTECGSTNFEFSRDTDLYGKIDLMAISP